MNLVEAATKSGYSRTAKDLEIRPGWRYYLVPYLPEPSPEPCLICLVIAVDSRFETEGNVEHGMRFARLDVKASTFRRLKSATSMQQDQLFHWVAWRASKAAE